jgi:hypothetical protein
METNKTIEGTNIVQIEKVLYTAKTHTTGGRDGASRSSDGRLDMLPLKQGLLFQLIWLLIPKLI